MTVVIHPTDSPILAENPILDLVHSFFIVIDLFDDGIRNLSVVIRMDHTPESVTGQFFKLIQISTAVDVENCLIGIEEFLLPFRLVNKKTSGHVCADFLDRR